MLKVILSIYLMGIVCTACNSSTKGQPNLSEDQKENFKDVDVEAFAELMKKEGYVILDVRTPEETAQGKIEGAIEIDVKSAEFENQIEQLDKDASYLVYCKSGGRSVRACDAMAEKGFRSIYNLLGGYTAWSEVNKKEE